MGDLTLLNLRGRHLEKGGGVNLGEPKRETEGEREGVWVINRTTKLGSRVSEEPKKQEGPQKVPETVGSRSFAKPFEEAEGKGILIKKKALEEKK